MTKIALFGGSFNPPGIHHKKIARELARLFDLVVVIPCGPRTDKEGSDNLPPPFRAVMADLTFQAQPRIRVDLFDLERDVFTRSWELLDQYESEGEVWLVAGGDLVEGGASGSAEIQTSWLRGPELWTRANFLILTRPGHQISPSDLPPKNRVLELDIPGSSSNIRALLHNGGRADSLLDEDVNRYIQRYGLYRASIPNVSSHMDFSPENWHVIHDPDNPRASEIAAGIPTTTDIDNAEALLVIGGDGTMLRAIRDHWRRRLPFFGCNAGHRGFLMNGLRASLSGGLPPLSAIVRQLPLLYLEMEFEDGTVTETYGFNDAWLERSTTQSAWLKLELNGQTKLERIVCDGLLVSTAAGSTAYALSMGAPPLLIDTPAWLVVGSNVMQPDSWKFAMLSLDTRVTITPENRKKRPVNACVDGISYPNVTRLSARLSRNAAAELAFFPFHDVAKKITDLQFRANPSQR